MSGRDGWRWTDDEGVQRLVDTAELRAALESGVLSPSTLVWREGMKAWAPAFTLPELATAAIAATRSGRPAAAPPSTGDRITPTDVMPLDAPEGKRPMMRTLTGLSSPADDRPSAPHAPIVVPSAGATPEPRGRVITQLPRYSAPPPETPEIPQAPRVPSTAIDKPAPAPKSAADRHSPPERKARTSDIDALWAGSGQGAAAADHGEETQTLVRSRKPGDPPIAREPAKPAAPARGTPPASAVKPASARKPPPPPTRPVTAKTQPPPPFHPKIPLPPPPQSTPPPAPVRSTPPPPPAARAASASSAKPPPPPPRTPPASAVAPTPPPAAEAKLEAVASAAVLDPDGPTARDEPRDHASEAASAASSEHAPAAATAAGGAAEPAAPPTKHTPGPADARPEAGASAAAAVAKLGEASTSDAPTRSEQEAAPRSPRPSPLSSDAPPQAARARTPAGSPSLRPRSGLAALQEAIPVPLSSLVGAGGGLMVLIICAFFFGRCSVVGGSEPRRALTGLGLLPVVAKAAIPEPPKPCWVARQPVMWAPRVSKSIPFEVSAIGTAAFRIGYARDEDEAVGVEVDAASGKLQERFTKKTDGEIDRVAPVPNQPASFLVSTTDKSASLRSAVPLGDDGAIIGLSSAGVAFARGGSPSTVFPADPESVQALRVLSTGDSGYAVTFRRDNIVWGGWIGPDGKARGGLVKIPGSGGSVGKPMNGWNGTELAVTFADKARGSAWKIRVGHAPGKIPNATKVFELPKGGPGGDAFAPDIAGLPDGRWILVWTEGPAGSRAIRAQTLAPDFSPLGDPIALSPPAGNFGQGVLGIAGSYATVVFLSKGDSSYELWGAILQCG